MNRRNSDRIRTVASRSVVVRVSSEGLTPHPPVSADHLRNCRNLTVYTVGTRVDGRILADVMRQCDRVERIHVERRDNDWDAQETTYALDDADAVADALRDHGTLKDFDMMGFRRTPLDTLVEALCTIPSLTCVTLKADHVHNYKTAAVGMAQRDPLLSVASLQALLGHVTQRLSLAGLFPEANEYQRALFRAFVTDHALVHIYIHFAHQKQPSPFAYFLRHVMHTNQLNPQSYAMTDLLQYVAKRKHFSLDAAFWIVRENPWLCRRSGTADRSCETPSRKNRGRRWRLFRPSRKGPG